MPPSDTTTANTPLAPSVEKAYYRKCIELKRRLNEVEAANDEAKIRRVRLDRSILKMRLERAFLLEQLSKRMEHNVDGSEGDEDDDVPEPPAARPHRDKRFRQQPLQSGPGAPPQSSHASQSSSYAVQSMPQNHAPPLVQGPGGSLVQANAMTQQGDYIFIPPSEQNAHQQTPHLPVYAAAAPLPQHASPYGAPPIGVPAAGPSQVNGMGVDGADERDQELDRDRNLQPIDREAGATGEAPSAGPSIREDPNSERKTLQSASDIAATDRDQQEASRSGFTAVNQ